MESADYKRWALDLCPELANRELYVHTFAELDIDPLQAQSGAFAMDYVRENTYELPDWRGPGAMIVLNTHAVDESVVNARFIHEMGHICPPSCDELAALRPQPTPEQASKRRASTTNPNSSPINAILHSEPWVRMVCHLYARAAAKGLNIDHNEVMGYEWLSHLGMYLSILQGEIVQNLGRTLSEVRDLPFLEALSERCEFDAREYKQHFFQKD